MAREKDVIDAREGEAIAQRLLRREGGRVLDSAACLIGHAPSLSALAGEGDTGPLALLLDAMDGVRASEGWLHLEVVGNPAAPGRDTSATVAAYLREQGAQHIWRGEVWDDRSEPGWRVPALVAARKLTACQRRLFELGAGRVLSGLTKRIDRELVGSAIGTPAEIDAFLKTI